MDIELHWVPTECISYISAAHPPWWCSLFDYSTLFLGPPGPPGVVIVEEITDTTATLSWSPGADNHSPISLYNLQARSPFSLGWQTVKTGEKNFQTAQVNYSKLLIITVIIAGNYRNRYSSENNDKLKSLIFSFLFFIPFVLLSNSSERTAQRHLPRCICE